MINIAFRFVRHKEVAEDIAQNVFIKIYEKKVELSPSAKFTTWLYRVAVNASLDHLRSKASHLISLDETSSFDEEGRTRLEKTKDPGSLSASEILGNAEIRDLVRREVEALPEKLKSCVLLYQFEEMAYQEIAAILGVSEKAVERRLHRAKQILKEKLGVRLKEFV